MNLILARWQFAMTTIYHFFNVPLTLGLSLFLALLETQYVRTGDEKYKRMVKFWGKIFLINFATGVVTGIVQEFQFGMNWSEYSRFMGDIFGAPLAIEALLAFYLESTFIGLWLFGWDKLSPKMHAAAIWLVALGSNISALWILVANSFMQHPTGYTLDPESGRALMSDFFALITNPNVGYQFTHVLTAGISTAGFVVLAFSAWHLLRKTEERDFFLTSFRWAARYALLGSVLVIVIGHFQGQFLVQHQPMKMAVAEALWHTEDPAGLSLLTIGDWQQTRDIFTIKIPNLLSFLSYNKPYGKIEGIYELQARFEQTYGPGDYIPPIALNYWAFRLMVGLGFLMILLAGLSVYWRNEIEDHPRLLRYLIPAGLFPTLASTFGWILAETGRWPWIVYGLLKVDQAVSPNVSAGSVAFSLVALTLLYTAVTAVTLHLILKFGKSDPAVVLAQAH